MVNVTFELQLFEISQPRLVVYDGSPDLIRNCNTPADYEWLVCMISNE